MTPESAISRCLISCRRAEADRIALTLPRADLFVEGLKFAGATPQAGPAGVRFAPIMGVIFALGLVLAGWAVGGSSPPTDRQKGFPGHNPERPLEPPPPVEPVTLQELPPDQAIVVNA